MTYKEALEKARSIDETFVYLAMIANEVDCLFETTGGKDREDFELLCKLVHEAYLKVDCSISLSTVVDALRNLIERGRDVHFITRRDITNNIL